MEHFSLFTTIYSGSATGSSNGSVLLTVVSGTLVAVLGLLAKELLSYYIFIPNQTYQNLRSRVAELLARQSLISGFAISEGQGERIREQHSAVADEYYALAAGIRAFAHQRNDFLSKLPTREQLIELSRDLQELSPENAKIVIPSRKDLRARVYKTLSLIDPDTVPRSKSSFLK